MRRRTLKVELEAEIRRLKAEVYRLQFENERLYRRNVELLHGARNVPDAADTLRRCAQPSGFPEF